MTTKPPTPPPPPPTRATYFAYEQWCLLCAEEGWNEATRLDMLEEWLRLKGLMAQFLAYARTRTAEENPDDD